MTEKEYETESWVKEILEKASKKAKYQIAREVWLEYLKSENIRDVGYIQWLDKQEEE